MNWIEKVQAGMILIASGCSDTKTFAQCKSCPFTKYCMLIQLNNEMYENKEVDIPKMWGRE